MLYISNEREGPLSCNSQDDMRARVTVGHLGQAKGHQSTQSQALEYLRSNPASSPKEYFVLRTMKSREERFVICSADVQISGVCGATQTAGLGSRSLVSNAIRPQTSVEEQQKLQMQSDSHLQLTDRLRNQTFLSTVPRDQQVIAGPGFHIVLNLHMELRQLPGMSKFVTVPHFFSCCMHS